RSPRSRLPVGTIADSWAPEARADRQGAGSDPLPGAPGDLAVCTSAAAAPLTLLQADDDRALSLSTLRPLPHSSVTALRHNPVTNKRKRQRMGMMALTSWIRRKRRSIGAPTGTV